MSIKAMNWAWQIDLIANKKLTLLCLADHADNEGVCWPGISSVVEKTGLSRRTVINFLQDFESGGLLHRKHRKGANGRQMSSVIELNLKAERMQIVAQPGANPAPGETPQPGAKNATYRVQKTPLTGCKIVHASNEEPTTEPKAESSALFSKSELKLESGPDVNPSGNPPGSSGLKQPEPDPDQAEDQRLAVWMFDLILKLHPKHEPPNFTKWADTIRLMREVNKRQRSEIASLFRWANSDSFWQTNILSPGKLRAKWDQLVIQRNARQQGPGSTPAAPLVDRRCAWPSADHPQRCAHQGISSLGSHHSSPWYCAEHLDHAEELASTRHTRSVELHA